MYQFNQTFQKTNFYCFKKKLNKILHLRKCLLKQKIANLYTKYFLLY